MERLPDCMFLVLIHVRSRLNIQGDVWVGTYLKKVRDNHVWTSKLVIQNGDEWYHLMWSHVQPMGGRVRQQPLLTLTFYRVKERDQLSFS